MIHLIEHTLWEVLGLLPFLFLAYLLMEWLEHRAGERTARMLEQSGKVAPLFGGLLGVLPQCGFSASAAGLYAGRVLSIGTLLAVFLSTSDEMLPILISHQVSALRIVKILAIKVGIAVVAGFAVDGIWRRTRREDDRSEDSASTHGHTHAHTHEDAAAEAHEHTHEHDGEEHAHTAIHELCESEGCHCERGILRSALRHTLQIFAYILVITFAFNLLLHAVGEETIGRWLAAVPGLGQAIAGLVGLIPNCAASVVITEMYLSGVISSGCMMAGLLVGSGIGLMVLFRVNHRRMGDNVRLVVLLYAVGVLSGIVLDLLGIVL